MRPGVLASHTHDTHTHTHDATMKGGNVTRLRLLGRTLNNNMQFFKRFLLAQSKCYSNALVERLN